MRPQYITPTHRNRDVAGHTVGPWPLGVRGLELRLHRHCDIVARPALGLEVTCWCVGETRTPASLDEAGVHRERVQDVAIAVVVRWGLQLSWDRVCQISPRRS